MEIEANEDHKRYVEETIGWTSLSQLVMLQTNIEKMVRLIDFQVCTLEGLDEGDDRCISDKGNMQTIFEFGILDVVNKVMILTETFLALCYAVGKGKQSNIAQILARYQQQQVDCFIEMLDSISLRRLFLLPDISGLNLEDGERKTVGLAYDSVNKAIRKKMERLVEFYQAHRIAHGKFKHGLSIYSQFEGGPGFEQLGLPKTFSIALDRASLRKPKGICYEKEEPMTFGDGSPWFNTFAILPMRRSELQRCQTLSRDIHLMADFMIDNLLLGVANHGKPYFPAWFPTSIEDKTFDEIASRLISNQKASPTTSVGMKFVFDSRRIKEIAECIRQKGCAVIWWNPRKHVIPQD